MSSKTGGNQSDGWLPDSKPSWWGTVRDFARAPGKFIKSEIAKFLVGAVLTVIEATTGSIRYVWEIFADAVLSAGDSLQFAFGGGAAVIRDAVRVFPDLLVSLASSLGISGPVLVGIGGIAAVFVLWQLLERAPESVWKAYQLIPGT